ncbi:MAG: glycosyltransferase family 2 protein [Alphaproteobacteria bacterium]
MVSENATLDVSIIAPVYNEEESLPHLVRSIMSVMEQTTLSWELIAVNDGSRDKSAEVLAKLALDYPQLQPVYFRRNYGQTAAMQAGFDHARGKVLITIDADLQNDPADIPRLLEHMEKTGADIVSGWRKQRKDNALIRNFPSKIANWLIARVTKVRLHDLGCSLKAYKREVMEDVRIYGELHRFIPIVVSQYGARIEELPVRHHARQYGSSKYGIDRTFRVILDLILMAFLLKYLTRPMHAFGMTGLISFAVGGLIGAYLTVLKLFGASIGGRPLLMLSVMLIILGVQLVGMGVLGELLMRIYHEPKGRKQYHLRPAPIVKKLTKLPPRKKR